MMRFEDDFVWGVSTSAYQIEGAADADGRGSSIWDTFTRTPGKVEGGDTADIATGHYHHYRTDVELLADLGVDAYRFSVAWSRIFPTGRGRPNSKGRDFYDRLVDALLERGIEPWTCLYHWDLPQALEDKGGWRSRDLPAYFADYASYVAAFLGDRVHNFFMINEPNVAANLGYLLGVHAPGVADIAAYAAATHHFNLATGMSLARLRSEGSWRLGTILNLEPVQPASDREEDHHATALLDAFRNRNFLDPLLLGRYPDASLPLLMPYLREGDLEIIAAPLDMLGLNYYTRSVVRADGGSLVGISQLPPPPEAEVTAMGWEVYPQGLRQQLFDLKENYGNPLVFITENGAAYPDRPTPDGSVDDPRRIRYLAAHLAAVNDAIAAGAAVGGYFVWTLLDNFEWAEGYSKRFGIVYVDFETLERLPKRSFYWYRDVVAAGGLEPTGGEPVD